MIDKVDFKDRKIGLILFGIIHIIIGAFCALGIPLTIFGTIAVKALTKSPPSLTTGQTVLMVLLYLLLAVWFFWMGIGSILARRWARALILITSWLWLLCGIGGFIITLFFLPDVVGYMAMTGEIPQELTVIVNYIVLVFVAIILLIIPGSFVLFYSSKHVKATCELRDPRVRWTDKVPLSVITLSSIFGAMAIMMPFLAFSRWAIPFFGFIVSGIPGMVVALVYMMVCIYASWGTYRLQKRAWWSGFFLTIASALSMGITFSRVSLTDFYEQMHVPKESLEMMKGVGVFQDPTADLLVWGIGFIGFLWFLIYTKKYFTSSSTKTKREGEKELSR
jgi:hypothetical protein